MASPITGGSTMAQTEALRQGATDTLFTLHGQSLFHDYRRQALWTWLERRLPPEGRVLDAGCGTGFMTRELVRQGRRVTAIDADEELVAFTRRLLEAEALEADVQQMPLGEGRLTTLSRFECIVCLDVIEHIEDDVRALAEIRDALSANGRLLLAVPAMPSLYGRRDRALGHYRRYGRRDLLDVCRRTSLRVDELRFWNVLGVPAYFLYERLLGRPIADGLRTAGAGRSPARALVRGMLRAWLRAEARSPIAPPAGLSLLAICRR